MSRHNTPAYDKTYFRIRRDILIQQLGSKCVVCGTVEELEIHHIKPINQQSRPLREYFSLNNKELRCKKHHEDTPNYAKRLNHAIRN